MMHDLLTPTDLQRMAADAGMTPIDLCRRAGVSYSTFTRWKRGITEPTLEVYRKLRDAALPPAAQGNEPANGIEAPPGLGSAVDAAAAPGEAG